MRMILVDPVEQTVAEVDVGGGFEALRDALGCHWIDIRRLGEDRNGRPIDVVIDDEGRLTDGQRCFMLGGNLLIAGRALIASHDEEGETTPCGISVADFVAKLEWLPEDTDYTPPPPVVTSYDSFEDMMAAMQGGQ